MIREKKKITTNLIGVDKVHNTSKVTRLCLEEIEKILVVFNCLVYRKGKEISSVCSMFCVCVSELTLTLEVRLICRISFRLALTGSFFLVVATFPLQIT